MEAVSRGLDRVLKGLKKEKEKKVLWIPPPPIINRESVHESIVEEGKEETRQELEVLLRGEEEAALNSIYGIRQEIGYSKNQIVLIGWAVYGCNNRKNLIYRNIIKYMDSIEKSGVSFKARHMKMKNGRVRRVNSYKQYRQIVYRQVSYVGKEELETIATIYQVEIRIFRKGNNITTSNMTCIEQIGFNYGRVVNLLWTNGEWALLGYEHNQPNTMQQVGREDRRRDKIQEKTREQLNRDVGRWREGERQEEVVLEIAVENEEGREGGKEVHREKEKNIGEGKYKDVGRIAVDINEDRGSRENREVQITVMTAVEEKGKTEGVNKHRDTKEGEEQCRKEDSECSSVDLLDIEELDKWLEQRLSKLSIGSEIEKKKADTQWRVDEEVGEKETMIQSERVVQEEKDTQGRRNGRVEKKGGLVEQQTEERRIDIIEVDTSKTKESIGHTGSIKVHRGEEQDILDKSREIRGRERVFRTGPRDREKEENREEIVIQTGKEEIGKREQGKDSKQKGDRENRNQDGGLESEGSSLDLLDKKELDKWLEKWVERKNREEEEAQVSEEGRIEEETNGVLEREERVKDKIDIDEGKSKKKSVVEQKGGQYRGAGSDCSSIDLLDKRELDEWLEQQVAKLSIASRGGEVLGSEEIEVGEGGRIERKDKQGDKNKQIMRKGKRKSVDREKVDKEKVVNYSKINIQREGEYRYEGQLSNKIEGKEKEKDKKGASKYNIRGERTKERQVDENKEVDEKGRDESVEQKIESKINGEARVVRVEAGEEGKSSTTRGSLKKKRQKTDVRHSIIGDGRRRERTIEEKEEEEGSVETTSSIEALFWEKNIERERVGGVGNGREVGEREKEREKGEKEKVKNREEVEKKKKCSRYDIVGGAGRETNIVETSNKQYSIIKEGVGEVERQSSGEVERKAGRKERKVVSKMDIGEEPLGEIGQEGVYTETTERGTESGNRTRVERGSLNQRKGKREIEEESRVGEKESDTTTSTIEALFWDRQTDRGGRVIGYKKITRRKVWERWKAVVRGSIRRDIRKEKKTQRKEEKEKEENKLVFDYTTKGLSVEEMQLLGKGEGFCVVDHKIDEDRNRVDIYNYQRRLRLHELFRDPGNREEEEENIVEVSRRTPGRRRTSVEGEGILTQTSRRESRINIERTERRESRTSRRSMGRSSIRGNGASVNVRESIVGEVERGRVEEKGRRLPSVYDPDSQNRNLNRYNVCIQEEIMLSMDKKVEFRDNIPRLERKALKKLKNRIEEKEIIITRADKGSGLVAVDYDTYISKGTRYIEEEAGAYTKVQELEGNIIARLTKDRNKIADQLKEKGVITSQTTTYIKKQLEEKITGIKFYYKIHKDRNIETMPLRPLQSCIKAPMQHLSIVLTDILQPLLTEKNIASFIFDSNQLLYRLRNLGRIPDSCTLISSDVSALYPSIPHTEGFKAMRIFLQEKTSYNRVQINSIIRALELVITENYMTWNRQIYKQVSGVAMGTPVAVAYANIFMDWVDKQVRQRAPYIYEHIRFIDDNLFILPDNRVEELMEIANNILPPYIKFTYEKLDKQSGVGLAFLDTQLFISEEKKIESRLYTKKTDRHAYLLPSSYHPPHITQNIPMAVFGRIKKICSREEWFREDAGKAEGWLLNRGYKKGEIKKAIDKTRQKDRWGMIEQIETNRHSDKQKTEGEVVDIPFIITYNQHGASIKKVLRDRQPLLNSAFKRTKVRPRVSYRRRRNLNDIIVQKGLRGPIEENRRELNIFSGCGEKPGYRSKCPCKGRHSQEQCRCCMHRKGDIEGIESRIFRPVNCNAKNLVYIIGCKQCSKKYIGETQQRLKDRLAQHMYNVEKLNQPLYLHFRYVHKLESLYIGVLETVRGGEPFMRKVREGWWINHLKTLEPRGFNVKLECNQVYEATS